jgi:hypothetical protein
LAPANTTRPNLAELCGRLREREPGAPAPALSVAEAVDALADWKSCAES